MKGSDVTNTTCTVPGCAKPHRAKGLCSTHYNHAANKPRVMVTIPCDVCGQDITREKRNKQKYPYARCSELCRQWREFGAWSSKLPAGHWALMYGATSTWSYTPPAPKPITDCAWCESEFSQRVGGQRYCSRKCAKRFRARNRKALERGAQGTYSRGELARLWLAFDKACAYCRTPTGLDSIQAEHVHPLARGGRNDLSNLLPSCGPCNSDKRDLILSEWNADRKRRNLKPVVTTWDPLDKRYRHLATRLEQVAA